MTRHSLAALLVALALLNVGWIDSTIGAGITWEDAANAPGSVFTGPDGRPWLQVKNGGGPVSIQVAKFEFPQTLDDAASYAITGLVQYRRVKGHAYIEMWSHFADGSRFYSRTLAKSGPMGRLHGDSVRPRPIVVPFYLEGRSDRPTYITVNVVLPSPGYVEVSPLEFEGFRQGLDPLTHAAILQYDTGEWWRERTGGMIGGIAGGALGLLGALVGVLVGALRAYRPARIVLAVMLAAGVASLVVGLAAVWDRQPYHVWYPPVLLAAIAVPLAVVGLIVVAARRRQNELRRIDAA